MREVLVSQNMNTGLVCTCMQLTLQNPISKEQNRFRHFYHLYNAANF